MCDMEPEIFSNESPGILFGGDIGQISRGRSIEKRGQIERKLL